MLTILILAVVALAVVLGHRGDRRAAAGRVSCFERKQRDHNHCEIKKEALCQGPDHNAKFALINAVVTFTYAELHSALGR